MRTRRSHAFALEGWGIEAAPRELAREARQAFAEVRERANQVAAEVAAERGLAARDYLSVLAVLKKEQLATADLVARYRERQEQIEAILRREDLVTIPSRQLRIRLGTREETLRMPAPRYDPAPLFGGNGEPGTFVIPLAVDASADTTFDDFGSTEGCGG